MTPKRWLLLFIRIVFIALIACVLITYIVDPFFQFRVRDNQYMISPRHCAAGLIKNYDYDTIIIGSSMTQNFNMEQFRTELNCSPLHIGIGGTTDEELLDYISLSNKTAKADTYYICIDIATFKQVSESKAIDYLLGNDPMSLLQYSTSYESWLRFLPIDVAFTLIKTLGISSLDAYQDNTSVDRFGYWGSEHTYGSEVVLRGRETGEFKVSDVDTTDLYNIMVKGIDSFFSQLDLSNAEYHFFFPPYSSLFWCDAQEDGYFETYLDAKDYFVERANEFGATVYDFQAAELTMDLNNYKDTTHFAPAINDWMTSRFADKSDIVTPDNCSDYREKLLSNTAQFRSEYAYLFG